MMLGEGGKEVGDVLGLGESVSKLPFLGGRTVAVLARGRGAKLEDAGEETELGAGEVPANVLLRDLVEKAWRADWAGEDFPVMLGLLASWVDN